MMPQVSPQSIFDLELLEKMSPEDLRFARKQLRAQYSKEMAKASTNLQRKQKILSNLELRHKQKQHSLEQESRVINQKLTNADQNRQREVSKKSKLRHAKQLKWTERRQKVEELQQRQQLEAERRQQQLNKKFQEYFMKKEMKSKSVDKDRSIFFQPQISHRHQRISIQESKEFLPEIKSHRTQKPFAPVKSNLNKEIKEHQRKRRQIQGFKEQHILQNYMIRAENIERRRQEVRSKSEINKLHPSQRRSMRSRQRQRQGLRQGQSEIVQTAQDRLSFPKYPNIETNKAEQYSRNKIEKQEQQFEQRTLIMENLQKQALKSSILKQIKSKVNELKLMAQR